MALCGSGNLHDNYEFAQFDLLRPAACGAGGKKGHSTLFIRMLTSQSHVHSATDYRAKKKETEAEGKICFTVSAYLI